MNLFVGTSGYSYKEWKGSFYPEDLSADDMLRYYSERFGTVEINSTFYRMPKASVLKSWMAEVPPEFRFILKSPRSITHLKRLRNADDSVAYFIETASALGNQLGPLLFQLPPDFKKDLSRLREFLVLVASVPPTGAAIRIAVEFRNASWFDDEVFALLRSHNAALCIADMEDSPPVPFVATADFGYLRLRRPDYTTAHLKKWSKDIAQQDWGDAFIFFKHEHEARGPAYASEFIALAAKPARPRRGR